MRGKGRVPLFTTRALSSVYDAHNPVTALSFAHHSDGKSCCHEEMIARVRRSEAWFIVERWRRALAHAVRPNVRAMPHPMQCCWRKRARRIDARSCGRAMRLSSVRRYRAGSGIARSRTSSPDAVRETTPDIRRPRRCAARIVRTLPRATSVRGKDRLVLDVWYSLGTQVPNLICRILDPGTLCS